LSDLGKNDPEIATKRSGFWTLAMAKISKGKTTFFPYDAPPPGLLKQT
jgi:hypothetical protein